MTKGFLFIAVLSVLMITSCDNPASIELKTPSFIEGEEIANRIDIALIYRYKCSICHGEKGISIIDGAPNLISTQLSVEEKIAVILNGRGTMPPQKDVLDMPTIRGLAVFIDSFK